MTNEVVRSLLNRAAAKLGSIDIQHFSMKDLPIMCTQQATGSNSSIRDADSCKCIMLQNSFFAMVTGWRRMGAVSSATGVMIPLGDATMTLNTSTSGNIAAVGATRQPTSGLTGVCSA